jgi:hypothetical protein
MVKITRLRLTGEEPFALEPCYLPAAEYSALVAAPLGRSSLFGALRHEYGVELAYADEEIDATAADPDLAEMLGLSKGAAILRIRQVIYSTKGKATIYVVGYYRSERRLQLGLATRSPASLLRRQLAESDISLDDSTVYLSANAVLEWPIHIATGPYRTLVSNATGNPSVVPFPPIEAADTLGR